MTTPRPFLVRGSYGTLTVDPASGVVLNYDPLADGSENGPSDPGTEYADIIRIDLDEWRKAYPGESTEGGEADILDVGFWTDKGEYIESEADARADIRAKLESPTP